MASFCFVIIAFVSRRSSIFQYHKTNGRNTIAKTAETNKHPANILNAKKYDLQIVHLLQLLQLRNQ